MRKKKSGKCPSADVVYTIKVGRKALFFKRDGKYWYTTSGDPRKDIVPWVVTTEPEMDGEWEWFEPDGNPRRETRDKLMASAPLFGVVHSGDTLWPR